MVPQDSTASIDALYNYVSQRHGLKQALVYAREIAANSNAQPETLTPPSGKTAPAAPITVRDWRRL